MKKFFLVLAESAEFCGFACTGFALIQAEDDLVNFEDIIVEEMYDYISGHTEEDEDSSPVVSFSEIDEAEYLEGIELFYDSSLYKLASGSELYFTTA